MGRGFLLYRWSDGSEAVLEPVEVFAKSWAPPGSWAATGPSTPAWARSSSRSVIGEEFRIGISEPGSRRRIILYPSFLHGHPRLTLHGTDPKVTEKIDGPFRAKLLGLFLDLGIERSSPFSWGLLGTSSTRTHLPFPKFVDDGVYARRYDEAANAVGKGTSVFLGCVSGFRIVQGGRMPGRTYSARWHCDNLPPRNKVRVFAKDSERRSTVEEVVDEVVAFEDVRPASERAGFIAREVDFGELFLLNREEVEVYRLLGERLPIFWESQELRAWLEERYSSSGGPS